MNGFQVDPKVHTIIAVIVALLMLAAQGSVALPLGIPAAWGAYITSWASFIVAIYVCITPILTAYSSSQPGPLAPPDPQLVKDATAKAAAIAKSAAGMVAIFAIATLLLLDGGTTMARAATTAVKTNVVQSIANSITADVVNDLAAGKAIFDALNDAPGSDCYGALGKNISTMQTAITSQTLPKVHLFTDIAVLRESALAAAANSTVNNACASLAQQTGQSVLGLINGAVTGVLKVGPLFGLP